MMTSMLILFCLQKFWQISISNFITERKISFYEGIRSYHIHSLIQCLLLVDIRLVLSLTYAHKIRILQSSRNLGLVLPSQHMHFWLVQGAKLWLRSVHVTTNRLTINTTFSLLLHRGRKPFFCTSHFESLLQCSSVCEIEDVFFMH